MNDSAIHSAAGAAGGILATTLTYPLIFLSTRAAVETKNHKSVIKALTDIVDGEGVAGLYSGLRCSLLGVAVTNGVYYFFYERARSIILSLRVGGKGLNAKESMVAGLIAGSAATIIGNPIWVVQTAQTIRTMNSSPSESTQTVRTEKAGFRATFRNILAKDGFGAFWRGLGPSLLLVIGPVLQFTIFEQLKNYLIASRTSKLRATSAAMGVALLTDLDFFLLGAFSKLVATCVTYPYMVVKSRLQAGQAQQHKSSLHSLLKIFQNEGVEGLYKGIGSKLVQSVLTAAILFAGQRRIYEITKMVIEIITKQRSI